MNKKPIVLLKILGLVLLDLVISNVVVFAAIMSMIFFRVFLLVFAGGGVSAMGINQIKNDFLTNPDILILLNIFSSLAVLAVFGGLYLLMNKRQYGNFHLTFRERKSDIFYLLVLGVSLQFILSFLLNLLLPLFPDTMDQYMELMDQLQVGKTGLAFVYTVMIAPVAEEITYRGVLLSVGRKAFSWKGAVVIQALLFGVMHMNVVQGIYAFLLGMLLGYICVRKDSIWPGILLHLFTNFAAMLVEPVMSAFTTWVGILLLLAGSGVLCLLSLRNLHLRPEGHS